MQWNESTLLFFSLSFCSFSTNSAVGGGFFVFLLIWLNSCGLLSLTIKPNKRKNKEERKTKGNVSELSVVPFVLSLSFASITNEERELKRNERRKNKWTTTLRITRYQQPTVNLVCCSFVFNYNWIKGKGRKRPHALYSIVTKHKWHNTMKKNKRTKWKGKKVMNERWVKEARFFSFHFVLFHLFPLSWLECVMWCSF